MMRDSLALALSHGLTPMQFQHTTLDNGLEVIAELNDRAHSVAAGFFVKTGSRDESGELAGVSHFLEHMTFKGTARRDAVAVNRDFDKVGAKHNAQTSEEDTFYHVTCLPEYLPAGLRRSLRHPPPHLANRRLRDREASDHRRDPDVPGQPDVGGLRSRQGRPFRLASAGQQHPGNRRVDHGAPGRPDARVLRAALQPANIVLAFAGKADWSSLVELANSHCGAWRGERGRPARRARFTARARSRPSSAPTTSSRPSWPSCNGPPLESPDRYAAHLLATDPRRPHRLAALLDA